MIKKNRIVRDLFFGIMLLLCQVSLSNASIIYADKSPGLQNITPMQNGNIIENTFKDPQSNAITTVRFEMRNNQLHQTIKRDDLSNKQSEEFSIHYEKTAANNLHVTSLEGKSPHSNQRWQKDISAEQVVIPANHDALTYTTHALYNHVRQSNGVGYSVKQNNTNTDTNLCNNIFLDDKPLSSQVAFLNKSNNNHGIKSALSSNSKIAVENGSYHYNDIPYGVCGDTISHNSNTPNNTKVMQNVNQNAFLYSNFNSNNIEKRYDFLGDIKNQFNQLNVYKDSQSKTPSEKKISLKPNLESYHSVPDVLIGPMPTYNPPQKTHGGLDEKGKRSQQSLPMGDAFSIAQENYALSNIHEMHDDFIKKSKILHKINSYKTSDRLIINAMPLPALHSFLQNASDMDLFNEYHLYACPNYLNYIRERPGYDDFILYFHKKIMSNHKFRKSLRYMNGFNSKLGFQKLIGEESERITNRRIEIESLERQKKAEALKAQHLQSMNDEQLEVLQPQSSGAFPEHIQEDHNSVEREDFETMKDKHHLSSQAAHGPKPKTFSEKHPVAYQAMNGAVTSATEAVVKEVLNAGFSYLSHIFSSKNNAPMALPQVQEPRSIPLGDFRAPLMPGRPDLHNIIPRNMHAHRIEMENRQKAAEYNPERMRNYNPGLIKLVESRIIIEQDITPSLLIDTTMTLPAAKDQVATSAWCENERQAALEATLDHKELPQPLDNNTQPFIFTDEFADVFKHPGKTPLDQQLHFELCSTRASMQLLAEKHHLFLPIKNMESLVNHLSALAKVQNDPKVAFCLADACHYLFAASQALDRMTEIVQKGVVLGVVNSAQHTIDLCHKMVSHPYDDVIKPLTLASASLAKAVATFALDCIKDPEAAGARMQAMSLALEEFVTKEPEQAVAYVVEFLLPSPVPNLTSLRKVFGVKKACKIEQTLEKILAQTKKVASPVCAPVQEFLKATQDLIKLQVKHGTDFFNKAIDKVKDAIRLEHQIAVATEAGIVNVCEKELVDHAKRAAKEELKHAPKAAVGGASAGAKIEGAAVTEATREVVLEKVATFEQARNKALELFGEHGGRTRPHYGSLGIFEGKITGRESLDRKMRWRLDYDPKKGPHVHIENFKHGKGLKNSNKVIPFDGNEKTVEALLKQLNK